MDAVSVGGAFLSSFLNVLFDRMASRQVVDFLRGQNVNDRLLTRLETAMTYLRVVLDDAEEKQIRNTAVRDWLDLLKDAVYKADDFLDEIAYEALRQELEAEDQTFTGQTQKRLSFINPLEILRSREIEEKFEVLLHDLNPLVERMAALGLINRNVENPSSHRTPTTSLVDESGVYGRDEDRKAILELLLSENANGENPGVVPIWGMGGVGKTTLARLVYKSSEVQEWFDLKAWVCVSEDFSVLKLTKVILEEVGLNSDSEHLNSPCTQLEKRLQGKKFLLVLDDVWNENYIEWDTFLTPLKCGARGSKILVTTRNERVALYMSALPTHLKELTEDSCLSLLSKHAFRGENPAARVELQEIGRAIARKCKGLPLAAKTLGGLLRTKRDVKEWQKILKSNLWDLTKDNILPALRLSYLHLPPHAKQCFAYCAIFPKDYSFRKDELVLLWMAEGFLVHSTVDDEMEEAGDTCFDDLVSRSFFQQTSASPSSFVMHDLMHDLATHVSGQFCFISRLGENNSSKATRRTRHLSLVVDTGGGFSSTELQIIREAQHLRTFKTFSRGSWCPPEFYNEIFQTTIGRLRVLFMTDCRGAALKFCSSSKLKRLRYLDLSSSYDLVKLPEEVSGLLNLQTLILKYCKRLGSLPDLGNLKHLRHLNLKGTYSMQRLPESLKRLINLRYLNIEGTPLKEMPPHVGHLTKLRTLSYFLVGRQSETSIKELGKLEHLRGDLHIGNLQNVVDARDAAEANLKGKEHLDELRFTWDGATHDPQHVTSTLEKLEPNRNVKDLCIEGYGGVRFPEWVGESSFSNIVSLRLRNCKNCTSLPPLGQLASLERLSIEAFDKVETVGSVFYGSCTAMKKPFESLKELSFKRMPEWREWISDEGSREAFPLLKSLSIEGCPKLTKVLPSHQLPCLKGLDIVGCKQLATPLPRFPMLSRLSLVDCGFQSLETLPEVDQIGCSLGITIFGCASLKCVALDLLPKLASLRISDCPDLESLCAHERPLNDLTSLLSLEIQRCPKLVSFPKGGLPASRLIGLTLDQCSNLKQLPESMHSLLPSLYSLRITRCSEVELCPEGGFPSTLQLLVIRDCNKLVAGRMQWGLQTLPSLSHFTIDGHENIESFP